MKFAKYSTLINENDMNLVNAIEFINQTKLENMPAEEVVRPQLTTEQVRTVKTRRVLRVAVWLRRLRRHTCLRGLRHVQADGLNARGHRLT